MPADQFAIAGYMRSGAARSGASPGRIFVEIAGVDRTSAVRKENPAAQITDELDEQPNTAQIRVTGFTPSKGQEIKIRLGMMNGIKIFAGRIIAVTQVYEDIRANVAFDLEAIDYTWLLNQKKVFRRWTSTSASTIATNLISEFTSGFTVVHVQAGLATIDEFSCTAEDVTDALSRLARLVGGYWYVDYDKDLRFFTGVESGVQDPLPLNDANADKFRDLQVTEDLSQVRTRIFVEGNGSRVLVAVAAGTTTLPLEDAVYFQAGGGKAKTGLQVIDYTGLAGTDGAGSTTGYVAAPTKVADSILENGTGGGLDAGAVYSWALTFKTGAGETLPSPLITVDLSPTFNQVQLDGMPVPTDPAITGKNLYRTEGGGSQLKFWGAVALATTSMTDPNGDGTLGANAPTVNSAGPSQEATAAGATTLRVAQTSVFAAGGGWVKVPGGQILRFTGRSVASGAGQLTGIPSSGPGAITAAVQTGTIINQPHLTGIPASGAGAIVTDIPEGEAVNVVAQKDDAAAQTALAALIGGDGIVEEYIQDNRLSLTEANNRAQARLDRDKNPEVKIRYRTRDKHTHAGATVTVSLGAPTNLSGTFKIQRVRITELETAADAFTDTTGSGGMPLFEVEASSKRFSLEDLLRRIRSTS